MAVLMLVKDVGEKCMLVKNLHQHSPPKGAPPVGPRFFKKRSDHMGNLLKIYFLTR